MHMLAMICVSRSQISIVALTAEREHQVATILYRLEEI